MNKHVTFSTWKSWQYAIFIFHPPVTARSINKKLTTIEHSYPMLQCAAVSTQYLWTNDPPQKCWPLVLCSDTMYLMEFGAAVWPPTIRPCMSTWPIWKQNHSQGLVWKERWPMDLELFNITVNILSHPGHRISSKAESKVTRCFSPLRQKASTVTGETDWNWNLSFMLLSKLLMTQNHDILHCIIPKQLPRCGFQSHLKIPSYKTWRAFSEQKRNIKSEAPPNPLFKSVDPA